MSIIIFIIILGLLIFVHELGHFLVAKKSGIRVDEFAIGFPPRIWGFKKGETEYALNLIPFGGYVKIFGENPDDESLDPHAKNSFVNKSKWTQAAVLVAGVLFNVLFAWLLFTISFMSGMPSVVTSDTERHISEYGIYITDIVADAPASLAGLEAGDQIISLGSGVGTGEAELLAGNFSVTDVQQFISTHGGQPIEVGYVRDDEPSSLTVTPQAGIVSDKPAIGIAMDTIGTLRLPLHLAIWEGFTMTGQMIHDIAIGLGTFIGQIFTGKANFGNVAGPVGIVSLVGNASQFGLVYLLGFTAFISLNLAVLNLVPFPALDGGRLLFVAIEAVARRPIPTKVANIINFIGFALLILLMIIITVSDVLKLF